MEAIILQNVKYILSRGGRVGQGGMKREEREQGMESGPRGKGEGKMGAGEGEWAHLGTPVCVLFSRFACLRSFVF